MFLNPESAICESCHRSTSSLRLRELIRDGCVAMPGVFNAAMGRLVEREGFDALYISGAGLCNATAGVPDIGLLTLTEVAQLAGYVAHAVKIPCIVDAERVLEERKTPRERSGNFNARAWPVAISRTRNSRNGVAIWPANRWSRSRT